MGKKARYTNIHVFAYDAYDKKQIEIFEQVEDWLHALLEKDEAYLISHIDSEAGYQTPAGKKRTYLQDVQEILEDRHRFELFNLQAPRIMVKGDDAFFMGQLLARGYKNGRFGIYPVNLFVHLKKQEDTWKLV